MVARAKDGPSLPTDDVNTSSNPGSYRSDHLLRAHHQLFRQPLFRVDQYRSGVVTTQRCRRRRPGMVTGILTHVTTHVSCPTAYPSSAIQTSLCACRAIPARWRAKVTWISRSQYFPELPAETRSTGSCDRVYVASTWRRRGHVNHQLRPSQPPSRRRATGARRQQVRAASIATAIAASNRYISPPDAAPDATSPRVPGH